MSPSELLAMQRKNNLERADLIAPEDEIVRRLCEEWGYGAVIDSAVRQWRRIDPSGAFTVGMPMVLIEKAL